MNWDAWNKEKAALERVLHQAQEERDAAMELRISGGMSKADFLPILQRCEMAHAAWKAHCRTGDLN